MSGLGSYSNVRFRASCFCICPLWAAAAHSLVREADLRDRLLSKGLPFFLSPIGEEAGDLSGAME